MGIFGKIKKGISHAVNEAVSEIKKPVKAIDKGIDHVKRELRDEIEKEYVKKYNHIVHHCYDLITEEIDKNYDSAILRFSMSKKWDKKMLSELLIAYKPSLIDILKGDIRKEVMNRLEKK